MTFALFVSASCDVAAAAARQIPREFFCVDTNVALQTTSDVN